jgi:dihydrofolate reductase
MSMSLDGYVAGRDVTNEQPFGDAGHRLHRWLGFEGTVPENVDRRAAAGMFENAGAVLIGRRMFDVGIDKWGEDGAFERPVFVVTHRGRDDLIRGATTFKFVTQGIEHAVRVARQAAGERDVVVAGGADIAQQCLAADLVDAMHLHIVPIALGAGTPLFASTGPRYDMETVDTVHSANAIHISLRVIPPNNKHVAHVGSDPARSSLRR